MNHAHKDDHSCCHTAPEVQLAFDGHDHGNPESLVALPKRPSPWPALISLSMAGGSMAAAMGPREIDSMMVAISATLAFAVIIIFGRKFLLAIGKLFRTSDMNTLIGISVLASFALSIWNWSQGHLHEIYFDSAAFIAGFVLLGQYFEALIHRKMAERMADLTTLLPLKARKMVGDEEHAVSLSELQLGDRLRVLVGERVPTDSRILDGSGTFDLSIITGESLPVTLRAPENIPQGALNVGQPILVEVTQSSRESLYFKLIREVQLSLKARPKIQQRVDKIATIFVPAVVALSIVVGIFWWIKFPSTQLFVTTAISVLVIACPCALGMATPTALFVGILRAGRRGILMKSLDAIDRVKEITMVAFDKTGTLTVGRPSVQRLKAIENFPTQDLLQLALSVEQESEHPYATAIRNRAQADRVKPLKTRGIEIAPGRGVVGTVTIENKDSEVVVGNLVWLFERHFDSTQVPADLQWDAEGTTETALWVGIDKKIVGIVFVADEIRQGAVETVEALGAEGYEVGMITGDSETVARGMAKRLKLKFFHAGVLPQEKATIVKRLHQPKKKGLDFVYNKVAFVGDGVNDAPALAEAHLGIAMGSGASISQATADVILLSNEISQVGATFKLLRSTRSLVSQNLWLSFGYNVLAIPVAAGALYPWTGWLLTPWLAAVAMALSSLTVLLNSLRALRA